MTDGFRFNPYHVPAGSSTGGEFGSQSGQTAQQKLSSMKESSGGKGGGKKTNPWRNGVMAYDPHAKQGPGYDWPGGNPDVKALQKALNRLGLVDGQGHALEVDGKLGPLTTQAINNAEKALGLKQDGRVTRELFDKLTNLKALPAAKKAAHVPRPRHPHRADDAESEWRESPLPHPGSAEKLHEYWVHGEGAARIGWGTPGDFDRCTHQLEEHAHFTPEQAHGYCNLAHHAATGMYPAQHAELLHGGKGRSMTSVFERSEMSGAAINDLPDSDFAYIEPGGTKDSSGRTTPRSLRHFPIHDAAHVRNALARAPQSPFGDKAMPKIRAAAKKFGIDVSDDNNDRNSPEGGHMAAVERRFTLMTVELRTQPGEQARIGGYAAMFSKVSQNLGGFVEVVERSFFNKSRGDGWPDVLCRYNHDDNMLLGTTGAGTLRLGLDETGLDYNVTPPQSRADVVELVQRGDVRKSSFAFRVPNGGEDWGLSDQGYPMRHLLTGQLVDVAPVNVPAYLDTSAAMRSLANKMDADVEEVRSLAQQNELRRFFIRTDNVGPGPKPKPTLLGAVAAMELLNRKQDPWVE